MPRAFLVALVGPTASGKTALAVEVARSLPFDVEVIGLDSRQVYRRLDVGTGKPTPDQRAQLRHHCIDCIDPTETYDAGSYRRQVERLLPEIWARGNVPLVVGGAGFYLKALAEGFVEVPADPDARSRFRSEVAALPLLQLRQRLQAVDPASAARIHPHDRYRVERALELHELTGRAASELYAAHRPAPVCGARLRLVHLSPPRVLLHRRIEERARRWLEVGWRQEVAALLAEGVAPEAPGLSILGYREVVALLRGELTPAEALAAIVVATRRYARSQEVWFRKVEVVEGGRGDSLAVAAALRAALTAAQERGGPPS